MSITDSLLATQLDFVSYNGAPAPHEISSLDKICRKSGKKNGSRLSLISKIICLCSMFVWVSLLLRAVKDCYNSFQNNSVH